MAACRGDGGVNDVEIEVKVLGEDVRRGGEL